MARTILVVDDSALARAATTSELRARGFAVTALGSAREIDEVDPSQLSAALLDVDLGDGLGTEVAERLRAAAPSLPIAFLTAGGPDRTLDEARRFGPVFSKIDGGIDEAAQWIAEAAPATSVVP